MFDAATQESLFQGAEARIRFQRDIDRCTAVEDAFVDDGDTTQGVIHGIVHVLNQLCAACRHRHRALGHIHGVEADFAARLRRVESLQRELVLLRILLCRGFGHRIKRVVGIFGGQVGLVGKNLVANMASERLKHGEEDAAVGGVDGAALCSRVVEEVEHTITTRDGVVLLRQVVQSHQMEQRYSFHRAFGEIPDGRAIGIAVVENVEHKVVGAHLIGPEIVHILHHQVPNGHFGVHRGASQQLCHQYIRRVDALVRELTYLIYLVGAHDGVLICHGKGLVGIEADVE